MDLAERCGSAVCPVEPAHATGLPGAGQLTLDPACKACCRGPAPSRTCLAHDRQHTFRQLHGHIHGHGRSHDHTLSAKGTARTTVLAASTGAGAGAADGDRYGCGDADTH
eukprot:2689402-Rhodomonas_salina.4